VLYRAKLTVSGFILLALSLSYLVSCDRVERHRVLNFFFDGVPPLETASGIYLDPNSADGEFAQLRAESTKSTHDTGEKCASCHGEQKKRTFDSEVKLRISIPQLCYGCHDLETESAAYVHGPVSIGDCLFCHSPHESSYPHLLKKPVPELCFQCHEIKVIQSIKDHAKKSHFRCLNCHNGHKSSVKYLLKNSADGDGKID
jgi:predicted CXXCH cytochrome family protein